MVVPQSPTTQEVLVMCLRQVEDGKPIYMRKFGNAREYPILDLTKILTPDAQANDANYHRYAFDWNQMNRKLSKEAIQFYKMYETNPAKNFVGAGNIGFIGFTKNDSASNNTTYLSSVDNEFNRWIDSETELIEIDGNTRRFCKVKILDLQTNQAPAIPIPTSIHITYTIVDMPIQDKKAKKRGVNK